MQYLALYRKYRPRDFSEVYGQDHIVKTLKNQLIHDRTSHAYLFCGTRGTGKTSVAKIFAKALNCSNMQDGKACDECANCISINESNSVNVIEVDAASNNGVDNIRDIRDEVRYLPTEGRFKVYIIDEVHMLSTGAFNALLKTLEEPPSHVVFILATTDVQKIPATILSRCQRLDFKRISVKDIMAVLKKYMAIEKIDIEEKAIEYIAMLANGALRDAFSILDQCISFYVDENINLEKLMTLLGTVDNNVLLHLADAIARDDKLLALTCIEEVNNNGKDLLQFLHDFLNHCRNLLVAKQVENPEWMINLSKENIEKLTEQAKLFSEDELIYIMKILSESEYQVKYAPNSKIIFELCIIKIMSDYQDGSLDAIKSRISKLEKSFEQTKLEPRGNEPLAGKKLETNEDEKPEEVLIEDASREEYNDVLENWKLFYQKLDERLNPLLIGSLIKLLSEKQLLIICRDEITADIVNKRKDIIEKALEKEYRKIFNIRIVSKNNSQDVDDRVVQEKKFVDLLDAFPDIIVK